MIEAGTLACDATFMIRHPILFTAMTVAFMPCGTVLAIILWRMLNVMLPIVLKEREVRKMKCDVGDKVRVLNKDALHDGKYLSNGKVYEVLRVYLHDINISNDPNEDRDTSYIFGDEMLFVERLQTTTEYANGDIVKFRNGYCEVSSVEGNVLNVFDNAKPWRIIGIHIDSPNVSLVVKANNRIDTKRGER